MRNFWLAGAAACLMCSVALADIARVENVQFVARLTGPDAINPTLDVNVGGTDLGHMVNLNGKTYFLFGDTFSGDTPAQGGHWRSNVMSYSSDADPSDGITFDGWVTDWAGNAREVIYSGYTNPITEIPTGAITVGNRIYTWFMAVNWWGPAGEWTNSYAGLAYWQEGMSSFNVVSGFEFPGNSNFGMVAASTRTDPAGQDDPYIYLWGTPAGRLGGVKLARVLPASISTRAQYEYFGGFSGNQPTWIASEFDAPYVVAPTVGEMSVMYNQYAGVWTMMYFSHNAYAIHLRQAPMPWGPWSAPIAVRTGAQSPGLYGSYMNPLYVENNGQTVYFTMSLWGPYDVYLMKADIVHNVPAPTITQEPQDVLVYPGETTAFNVAATGASTLHYQWTMVNPAGPDLPVGTDSPTLTITTAAVAHEGLYYCVITNTAGVAATSRQARLDIKRLKGHWPMDHSLADASGDAHPGRYVDATDPTVDNTDAVYATGRVDASLVLTRGDDRFVEIDAPAAAYNFWPGGFTVSAWVNTTFEGAYQCLLSKQYRVAGQPFHGWVLDLTAAGAVEFNLRGLGAFAAGDVNDGQWHLVTATYDADTALAAVYVDGVQKGLNGPLEGTPLATDEPLRFGAENVVGLTQLQGMLDEVQIYNYALSDVDVAYLFHDFTGESVCVESARPDVTFDLDHNCIVDLRDLVMVLSAWLDCGLLPDCIN